MSNLVNIESKSDFLLATATGEYCLEDTINHFQEILSACLEFKVYKVLLDFRQTTSELSMADELIYLKRMSQEYQSHLDAGYPPVKIAYLGLTDFIKPHSPSPKMGKEMGLEMILTENESLALEWLSR